MTEPTAPINPNRTLKITIFTTTEDIASQNIKGHLLRIFPFERQQLISPWDPSWVNEVYHFTPPSNEFDGLTPSPVEYQLIGIDKSFITLDDTIPPDQMHGDIVIFASRHRSKSERKALLCHTTGNLSDDNSFGGQPNRVSCGSGILTHYLYHALHYVMDTFPEYQVPIDHEVDHHGPTQFHQPSAFIELGSTETGWRDQIGGEVVAKSIIHACNHIAQHHFSPSKTPFIHKSALKIAIGFGGGHYMPSFQPIIMKDYGFAHTIPKYKVMAMTAEKIKHIINQTLEPINNFVLDWKGMNSAEKHHLVPLLESTHIPIIKTKTLRNSYKNR
ncbi:MAG: D-aminoacyl-tRNA deacylase [Promethearchaeota archaeon]